MDERYWSVVADRYRLGRRLDRLRAAPGGVTYIAYDLHLDQKVAVTLHSVGGLQGQSGDYFERADERFILVNRRLARVHHEGIPEILDIGHLDREIYVVTRLIDGDSLAGLLSKHGPLNPGTAAAIGAHICAVLHAAHSKAVTHGNLTSADIVLCVDNTVKVLGFGNPATPSRPTAGRASSRRDENVVGDAYQAPEQIKGAHGFPASDLYAVGCVLKHMVTGQPSIAGPGAAAPDHRDLAAESARVAMPNSRVVLDRLISELMAETPGSRPRDAAAVYNQLLELIEPGELALSAGSCDPSLAFNKPGSTLLRRSDATAPGLNYFPSDPEDHDIRSHMEGLFGLKEDCARKGHYHLVLDAVRGFLSRWSFLADHPEGLYYRFDEAELLLALGEPQEALTRLTALVDLLVKAEPQSPTKACECRMLIGDCLIAAGRTEDALTIWRSTLTEWVRLDGLDPKTEHLRQRIRAAELAVGPRR